MIDKAKISLILLVVIFGLTACASKGELTEPLLIDSDVSVFQIPGDIRPLSGEIVIRRHPYYEKVRSTTASNFILVQDKSQYFSQHNEMLMEVEFRTPDRNSHEIIATVFGMFEKSNTESTKNWAGRISMQVAWNPNSGVITKKSINGGIIPEDKQDLFDDSLGGIKKWVENSHYFDVPISQSNSEFFYKDKIKLGTISGEYAIKEKVLGETIYKDIPALVSEYLGSIKVLSGLVDANGIRVISKENGALLYLKNFASGTFKEDFGDIQVEQSEVYEAIEYQPL